MKKAIALLTYRNPKISSPSKKKKKKQCVNLFQIHRN